MIYKRPKLPTEARVVFEICNRLRTLGIEFDLEYMLSCPFYRNSNKSRIRLDIVIIKNGTVRGAIEVKRSVRAGHHVGGILQQLHGYKRIAHIPFVVCFGFEEMGEAIAFSKRITGWAPAEETEANLKQHAVLSTNPSPLQPGHEHT